MKKNFLLHLLSQGKTDLVIAHLMRLAPNLDEDIREEIVQQAARMQSLAREKRLGVLSYEEQTIQLARINAALVELIRQLPEGPLSLGVQWRKILKWGGWIAASLTFLAAVAEISGYSLRDIFNNHPKVEETRNNPPTPLNPDTPSVSDPQTVERQPLNNPPSVKPSNTSKIEQTTTGDKSPTVVTGQGNVTINYGDWESNPSPRKDTTKNNPTDTTKKQ